MRVLIDDLWTLLWTLLHAQMCASHKHTHSCVPQPVTHRREGLACTEEKGGKSKGVVHTVLLDR